MRRSIPTKRFTELVNFCRNPANFRTVCSIARKVDFQLAPFIAQSAVHGYSYYTVQRRMGDFPPDITESDFYDTKRLFFALLDQEIELKGW